MENETANKRVIELKLVEIEKLKKEIDKVSENIDLYKKIKLDKEQELLDKQAIIDSLK